MQIQRKMTDLLEGLDYTTAKGDDATITGLAFRSDKVTHGDLFFCIPGFKSDGHAYAPDAVSRGCAALVVKRKLDLEVPQFIVEDPRKYMGIISSRFYGDPSEQMDVVGVTGTNGKTTTTYLVDCVARHMGKKTGIIGTIGAKISDKVLPGDRTTPESPDLQSLFAEMVEAGCSEVAMEVSSHAIELHRVMGTRFSVVAFSNLTQDHLDFHKTMEGYFSAKAALFDKVYSDKAAICIDGEYGQRLSEMAVENGLDVITCGFNEDAYVHVRDVEYLTTHTKLALTVGDEDVEFDYALIGRFNVENIMVATSICLALGYPLDVICEAFSEAAAAPGRLDRVISDEASELGISVYVDYAHTPDSIIKAIAALRPICEGRIIIVFGCGGDRDALKRPLMGAAACKADYAIVTNDNPRTEKPSAIITQILPGMQDSKERYEVIEDRRSAIRRAIELAEPKDAVLIAGKGHETYQIIGTETFPFDDKQVAAEEIAKVAKQGE